MKSKFMGHLLAIITVVIWSTTFISTKVLLRTFEPIEILLLRFALGYIVLLIISPKRLKLKSFKEELMYAVAGFAGISLYYMLENTALIFTMASNAGVIISTAPIFTAVLAHFINKNENRFRWNFFVGSAVALVGIFFISFNGAKLQLNPVGDLMIVGAALAWAVYCVVLKKINSFGYSLILNTRRIFVWGIAFLLPCVIFTGFSITGEELIMPQNIGNLLFLGIAACALCFMMWNHAVSIIGAVSANFYIYLTPVATLVASAILLHEPITPLLILGTVLTLAGLVLSEMKQRKTIADN